MSLNNEDNTLDELADNQDILPIYLINAALAAIAIIVVVFVLVFIIKSPTIDSAFDYTQTGQIGDTIGGISAPFIGVIGIVLTFLAFYIQFKANQIQFKQFQSQKIEKIKGYHERKVLYLMQQNRNIVENIVIDGAVTGPISFEKMFDEFRVTHAIVRKYYHGKKLEKIQLLNISYLIFFNGVTGVYKKLNTHLLTGVPDLDGIIRILRLLRDKSFDDDFTPNVPGVELSPGLLRTIRELGYRPFQGHMVRLGQYFRNLFHLLKYTTSLPDKIFTEDDKYQMIKSLRSQMSSYEQLLVYYNSLSLYGKRMRDEDFINIYKLIKNIPLPLVFGGNARNYYPNIIFEWDQVVGRIDGGNDILDDTVEFSS